MGDNFRFLWTRCFCCRQPRYGEGEIDDEKSGIKEHHLKRFEQRMGGGSENEGLLRVGRETLKECGAYKRASERMEGEEEYDEECKFNNRP